MYNDYVGFFGMWHTQVEVKCHDCFDILNYQTENYWEGKDPMSVSSVCVSLYVLGPILNQGLSKVHVCSKCLEVFAEWIF